jgi:hypothetical protein
MAHNPTLLGSGGGGYSAYSTVYPGGIGGGALRLIALESLVNYGVISCDGGDFYAQSSVYLPGGGSGGSLWIESP